MCSFLRLKLIIVKIPCWKFHAENSSFWVSILIFFRKRFFHPHILLLFPSRIWYIQSILYKHQFMHASNSHKIELKHHPWSGAICSDDFAWRKIHIYLILCCLIEISHKLSWFKWSYVYVLELYFVEFLSLLS